MYKEEIESAADWIVKNQTKNESFQYEYDALTGKFSTENKIARQAGTAFILSEYYLINPKQQIINIIDKCLQYLEKISIYENSDGTEIVYSLDGKVGKVNMAAFVISTLSNLQDQKIRQKYERFYKANLAALLKQERTEGGFRKLIYPPNKKKRSSYADGESLLALTYLYKTSPTPQLQGKITHHLSFFDLEYGKLIAKTAKTAKEIKQIVGFYLWGIRSLDNLPAKLLSEKMLNFAQYFTENILQRYNFENEKIKNLGAILEGVVATVSILAKSNQTNQKFEKALKDGITNMLNLQFSDKNIAILSQIHQLPPENAKDLQGGFFNSLSPDNLKMRIDYTQHSLGALLIAAQIK